MKNFYTLILLPLIILSSYQSCYSTHLLGGELNYTLLDSSSLTYEIELRVYRDCFRGTGPFDPAVNIFIFEKGSNQFQTLMISNFSSPLITSIPDSSIVCNLNQYTFCLESRSYKGQISLAPSSLGYDIGWARCCLSNAFTNLQNPLGQGLTYGNSIPRNDSILNSSPKAYNQLYDVHCSHTSFAFDFSTTDPEGDSLVYLLSDIYGGLNTQGLGVGNPMQGRNDPTVDPFNNPMGAPPYIPLNFLPPFISANPANGNPFILDPETGILSGDGVGTGIYLLAIEIQEYRNGRLISSSIRDLPLSFTNCHTRSLEASIDFLGQETVINGLPVLDYQDSSSLCIKISASSPDTSDYIRITPNIYYPGLSIDPAIERFRLDSDICWRYDSLGLEDTCIFITLTVRSDVSCPNDQPISFSYAICYDSARTALSIQDKFEEIPLSIYPNPGNDYLILQTDADLSGENTLIRILSLNGQLKLEKKLSPQRLPYKIDTASLEAGMYLIEFSNSNGRAIRKWIKE